MILGGIIFIIDKEAYIYVVFWETKFSEKKAVWLGIMNILFGILFIGIYINYVLTAD